MRACIAREESMYLPGKGFKGWPEYPPEVFVYSPGATLNLLQMDMVKAFPMDKELEKSVDRCLEMARDAAKAHGIDPAPASSEVGAGGLWTLHEVRPGPRADGGLHPRADRAVGEAAQGHSQVRGCQR